MIGDGVEPGYLAPDLGQNHVAESDIAVLFTVYGATVAIGSWGADALSNIWGPRRVMWLGAATFWLSLVLVALSGLPALLCMSDAAGPKCLAPVGEKPLASLVGSVPIMWKEPKMSLGAVVRTIHTASMFGLFVILPGFFMDVIGLTLEQWLRLVTVIFVSNIAGNLISSRLANRFGLRNTVIWMGAIVAIFSAWLGVAGIIWIFAGLYALSAVLLVPLRDPADLKSAPIAAH